MTLFQFTDYRAYFRERIAGMPNKGRGELTKLAQHLRVNTTLISQVLAGSRNFNEEQTLEVSLFFGHNEIETEYFALLIQLERAGTENLKRHLEKKRIGLVTEAAKLSNRVAHEKRLSEADRAIFYSSYIYSAAHLFTSTRESGVTLEEVASRLNLSRARAAEVLGFLLRAGLVLLADNNYTMSTQSTFLPQGSPHLLKHHANWRVQAMRKTDGLEDSELMYSGQFSLSRADFARLRESFAELLKTVNKVVKDSPAEDVACLNLDWFWLS